MKNDQTSCFPGKGEKRYSGEQEFFLALQNIKNKIKNSKNINLFTTFFEIFILILSIFSFSYLLSKTNFFSIEENKKKNMSLKKFKKILKEWVQRSRIGLVSAQEEKDGETSECCVESKEGAFCGNFPVGKCEENCKGECIPSKCNEVLECKKGCCITSEGVCVSGSVKRECEGEWKDDASCNIPECKRGCCVLGDQTRFVTLKECEFLSKTLGLSVDFRADVDNELSCYALTYQTEEGACIIKTPTENKCELRTAQECEEYRGTYDVEFFRGILCSHPRIKEEFNISCERQAYTGCVKGRDEVYWFDSCGNRENIYSSNKEESWNNGFILNKSSSCNPEDPSGNLNSVSCGNCNFFAGTTCGKYQKNKPTYGEYTCISLDCVDENGVKRKHGSSWCIYDGTIDKGKDLVGSLHWRRYCYKGKISEIEQCGSYRDQICVESETKNENGETFTTANCRINRWQECITYNSEKDKEKMREKCKKNSDCYLKVVDIDEGFKFDMCVPRYPPGFDMKDEKSAESAEGICGMASQQCVMIDEKKITGRWKCVYNCKCKTKEFTKQMNELCTSLGDCGFKRNFVGDVDEGAYAVSGAPALEEGEAVGSLEWEGNYANPGNLTEFFRWIEAKEGYEPNDISDALKIFQGVSGGLGGLAMLPKVLIWTHIIKLPKGVPEAILSKGATTGTVLSAVGNGLSSATLVMSVTLLLVQTLKLKGDAALSTLIVGGVVSSVAGFVVASFGGAAVAEALLGITVSAFFGGLIIGGLGALVVVFWAGMMKIFEIGETRKKIVEFRCYPCEKAGSDKCDLCNEIANKEGKPCTPYRCHSLGANCEFINEGTEEEKCIELKDDGAPPIIEPDYEALSEGYRYVDVSERGFRIISENGECLPRFTPIFFGIKTNEKSRCKFSLEPVEGVSEDVYELFPYYFGGRIFKETHKMPLFMPTEGALKGEAAKEINISSLSDEEKEEFNRIVEEFLKKADNFRIYVRCEDYFKNRNQADFIIETCFRKGPDLTPPVILKTIPENESFVKFNATEKEVKVFVSEPAECKWSLEKKEYEEMENKMDCNTNSTLPNIYVEGFGYKCSATLPINPLLEENIFYLLCKDQPHLSEDNESRLLSSIYTYVLKPSQEPLRIINIKPKDEIVTVPKVPATVELNVETGGGVEDVVCFYGVNEESINIPFFETFSTYHKNIFDQLSEGKWKFYIKCKDSVGNEATNSTSFEVVVDKKSPRITRIYFKEGLLYVITDEDSVCKYSDKEKFNFDEAKALEGLEKKHFTSLENLRATIYYIQCADNFGNIGKKIGVKLFEISEE